MTVQVLDEVEAHVSPQPLNFDPGTVRVDRDGWLWAQALPDRRDCIVGVVQGNVDETRRLRWEAVAFLAAGRFKVEGADRESAVAFLVHMLGVFRDQGLTVARPRELTDVPEEDPPGAACGSTSWDEAQRVVVGLRSKAGRSAALEVPAPLEEWARVCTEWGVPARPDELVRVVQAAAWDAAGAQHAADARVVRGARG